MGGDEKSEVADAVVDQLGGLVRRWRELSCARTRRYDPTGEIETELSGLLTWEEHSAKLQLREVGEQLCQQGGSELMLHIWYRVGDRYGLATATRLWRGWESVCGWPP